MLVHSGIRFTNVGDKRRSSFVLMTSLLFFFSFSFFSSYTILFQSFSAAGQTHLNEETENCIVLSRAGRLCGPWYWYPKCRCQLSSNFSAWRNYEKVTFVSEVRKGVGRGGHYGSVEWGYYKMGVSRLVHPVKNVTLKYLYLCSFIFSPIWHRKAAIFNRCVTSAWCCNTVPSVPHESEGTFNGGVFTCSVLC